MRRIFFGGGSAVVSRLVVGVEVVKGCFGGGGGAVVGIAGGFGTAGEDVGNTGAMVTSRRREGPWRAVWVGILLLLRLWMGSVWEPGLVDWSCKLCNVRDRGVIYYTWVWIWVERKVTDGSKSLHPWRDAKCMDHWCWCRDWILVRSGL